nr:kinesin-like protein KIN-7O isoform X1 [Tanacetum cinerariifolium]
MLMRLKATFSLLVKLCVLLTVLHTYVANKKWILDAESQGDHVPYRDTKPTRILQPAQGGNANTTIICNITLAQSPLLSHRCRCQDEERAPSGGGGGAGGGPKIEEPYKGCLDVHWTSRQVIKLTKTVDNCLCHNHGPLNKGPKHIHKESNRNKTKSSFAAA